MRRVVVAAAMFALFASVFVNAQDEAKPVPKLVFKTSGETVFDFGVEIALDAQDTSTAKGVVMAWSNIANHPKDFNDLPPAPETVYNGLANKALSELEKGLFSAELAARAGEERIGEQNRESSYQSARKETVVESEETLEDGSVTIITSQERVSRYKDRDDKWEVGEPRKSWFRYHVVKDEDGKWRIDNAEQGREDRKGSKDGELALSWEPMRNAGLEFAYESSKPDSPQLTKPELKSATPNETAMAFVALRDFSNDAQFRYFGVLCKGLEKATIGLFTRAYVEGVHKASDDRAEKNKNKKDNPPEIEGLRDETETSATVVFKKTDSKASDKFVVKVVKDGEVWRVTELGALRDADTEGETYVPKQGVYSRR
ncbi:MAG: hypothetical protein H6839_11250 [Planctomycetes bacterium]|nr:hypothetical protein [Planctomycetota bacterium]